MSNVISPKILYLDIETAPIIAYIWALHEQNVALNQIKEDWHLMSFAALWDHSDKIIYMDQRNCKNIEDDRLMLNKLWELLDEADIVIGQNSKKFDTKKINARFMIQKTNKRHPPSDYRHIDILIESKKYFAFTSHKLEYKADKLNEKYKKLKHSKYPGLELWKECLKGNVEAWDEMKKYNIHDVLATKENYHIMKAWIKTINFDVFHKDHEMKCTCGSTEIMKNGYRYTNTGKFQKLSCKSCGKAFTERYNELSEKKRHSMSKP